MSTTSPSHEDDVKPEDSASQCSHTTSTSSSRRARMEAMVRSAALQAEVEALKEQQELELQELRLHQRRTELQMKTKLSCAEAEAKVYAQFDDEKTTPVSSSQSTPSPPDEDSPSQPDPSPHDDDTSGDTVPYPIEDHQSSTPQETPPPTEAIHEMLRQSKQQQQSLIETLQLPKAELMCYEGDPLKFWEFWRAFEVNVDSTTISNAAKLTRLLHYCKGEARRVIQACSVMESTQGYARAKTLLKERFGNKYKVADAWMKKVTRGQTVSPHDGKAIREMADELKVCYETLQAMGYENEMAHQSFLRDIVERLPNYLRYRWVRKVRDLERKEDRMPKVKDLVAYIDDVAEEENNPVYGTSTWERSRDVPQKRRTQPRQRGSFAVASVPERVVTRECSLCKGEHTLFGCQQFKAKSPQDRLSYAKQERLCFNCLRRGHMTSACRLNRTCTVSGCGRKHTKFLHIPQTMQQREEAASQANTSLDAPVQNGYIDSAAEASCSNVTGAGRTVLPIVPVRVKAAGGSVFIRTHALLDTGSTNTFCTEHLARQLGVEGAKQRLNLTTLDKMGSSIDTTRVSLIVDSGPATDRIELPNVFTKHKINIQSTHMAKMEEIAGLPYLQGIDLPFAGENEVGLLIGQDIPRALMPLEIRRGKAKDGPYAVRTALGWSLHGPVNKVGTTEQNTHATSTFIQGDIGLEEQVHKFWKLEASDTLHDERGMSVNDQRALKMWKGGISIDGGHYQLPVPFKRHPPCLPNNRWLAEQRLQSLARKLGKDDSLRRKYQEGIEDLLKKGYAEEVEKQECQSEDQAIWYLPHHPVFHPMKPDKLRIVFDCAAKSGGVSLNDEVLQGPDLTNKLTGVLLRFRQGPVAFMADVEAMFHQVRVPVEERDVLRFLWWPSGDMTHQPKVYRMCVHLFGGTWSPSCCNFALRQTADDNQDQFSPEAVEIVKRNFYVDDCLVSVESEEKAVNLSDELRNLLQRGGFKLTKWLSNKPSVLKSIPTEERSKQLKGLDLNLDALPVDRALGVSWDVERDCLGYKLSHKDKPLTRRGLLSIVSSIYDPLGYANPFILRARLLLQELTRMKLGWDDPVPEEHRQIWQGWSEELAEMKEFEVNRCVKPHGFGTVTEYQLHHFADASEKAYGAVSYLVMKNTSSELHSSLVMAKSHLAPLKTMTIPRLELAAATLAAKLDVAVKRELDVQEPIHSTFWTDSTIVLQYIRSTDGRFRTFAANRIATIHNASEASQWHYVDTKSNPADDISRGMSAGELKKSTRWLQGPEFLLMPQKHWPKEPQVMDPLRQSDPELKKSKEQVQIFAVDSEENKGTDKLLQHYSSWHRLKKAVAWILRVREYLQNKNGRVPSDMKKPLTVDDLDKAEQAIIRHVQRQAYTDEYQTLHTTANPVKKSSPLYRLDPKINSEGVMCVGGRLKNSKLQTQEKHPVILPKKNHIVELLVRHFHAVSGHSGREHVMSLMRQRYWVIGGRTTVRQVLHDCFVCKRRSASPSIQKMANLPEDRVTPEKPPFNYVGVDCFGPFLVKQGRSQVKRYGCIFTCLAIRAVHIEVLHSMETDSFLNALQRFMARRGQPELIRCDNGTNFVGAERELREGIKRWNKQQVHEYLLQKGIRWKFNPPAASHMGGPWERQIRTVRKILNTVMKQQVLHDESLSTMMCLVESVINGRPLTVVSDDARDPEPLTPNHLLLLRQNSALPVDVFQKQDQFSRKRWRHVQYLADVFWRRWIREYLPTLQQRGKWNEPVRNIEVGDIVLIVEDQPRNQWSLGRVVEIYAGEDKLVRSAKIKTRSTTLVRPIHKLCLMESAEAKEK
ncbi:uncharacterized protein LOC119724042 [Patiria miniata]|uniref:Integrase catalytic domain-containing protein n=1 Tax=Patiria miniata TaxID=46514 RepID=A0A913ZGH2_PATMI|nr:uncharacterized protein LOC119724042 [Patiria miniata]